MPRRERSPQKGLVVLALLILSGCSGVGSGSSATTACDLSLSSVGPTEEFTFAGLGEDAAKCLMTSWRGALVGETPAATAIFLTGACGQGADGSLGKPYCRIEDALQRAEEIAQQEKVPELYLDPGDYAMHVALGGRLLALKVRGLCSETTVLSPSVAGSPIIEDDGAASSTLSMQGVTLVGGEGPVLQFVNSSATLRQVRVEQSVDNACFWISGANATLDAQSVSFDGPVAMIVPPTPSSAGGESTMMPTVGSQAVPRCIIVEDGATLVLEDFSLHDFEGVAIHVIGVGSQATFTSGEVNNIAELSTGGGGFGYAMVVEGGATATLDRVTISACHGAGIAADGEGTTISITNTSVGQTQANTYGGTGVGIIVQDSAQGTIDFSAFEDNAAPGIFLSSGSSTTIGHSLVTGNTFSDVALTDAGMTLTGSSLGPTVSHASEQGGIGLFIQGKGGGMQAAAEVAGNVITGSPYEGIYLVDHAGEGMNLAFEGNDIRGNATLGTLFLSQIEAIAVSGAVRFDDNCIQSGGVTNAAGLWIHLSSGIAISGNQYVGSFNPYVIHQQQCVNAVLDSVDDSSEILPPMSVNCICGVRSDSGGACSMIGFPVGPTLNYNFAIEETEAIE